jgi:outer membrane scaffolding protein for murein synthesis (MipA/OmpV family)
MQSMCVRRAVGPFFLAAAAAAACAAHAAPVNWTVEAGAAVRERPAHIGSNHYVTDGVPIFEAAVGDDVSLSLEDGAKWRALHLGPVAVGPIAEYRQSFSDELPSGAFRMSDTVEIGGFGEWRTPIGIAEARLRHAVNGYDGWSGDITFDTGGAVTPKLLLGGEARLSWADSNFTQEYFGLTPHAATHFGFPRFQEENFLTAGAELDAAREITPWSRLVLELSADHIISELRTSPLFSSRDIFTATLGLTYRWSAKSTGHQP